MKVSILHHKILRRVAFRLRNVTRHEFPVKSTENFHIRWHDHDIPCEPNAVVTVQ